MVEQYTLIGCINLGLGKIATLHQQISARSQRPDTVTINGVTTYRQHLAFRFDTLARTGSLLMGHAKRVAMLYLFRANAPF